MTSVGTELERRANRLRAASSRPLPALSDLVALWVRCGQAVVGLSEGLRRGPDAGRPHVWPDDMLYHEENFLLRLQRLPHFLDAAVAEGGGPGGLTALVRNGAPLPPPWATLAAAARQLHNPVFRHLLEADSPAALRRASGRDPVVDPGYVSVVLDELLPVYEEMYAIVAAALTALESPRPSAPAE